MHTAIWTPTSVLRNAPPLAALPITPRPSPFTAVLKSCLVACRAGTNPNTIPVMAVRASEYPQTCRSGFTFHTSGGPTSGKCASTNRAMPSIDQSATIDPKVPPRNAISRLSVSSCRTMRHRLPPIESRIAISFCLADARAKSRFATFAQAISNTNPTAARTTAPMPNTTLRSSGLTINVAR